MKRRNLFFLLVGIAVVLLISPLFAAKSIGKANPNPFKITSSSSYTTIEIEYGGKPCVYDVKIYDMMGRLVISFTSGSYQSSPYSVNWDGRNSAGRYVKSGVYFAYVKRTYQDTSLGSDDDKFRIGVIR